MYELNPDLFTDFAGKFILYEAGISVEKPNTTIVIEKSAKYVADLLELDRDLSDEVVEKVLTGETYDWFNNDSWGYYYENAEDSVDDLNKENYEAVIDKIVEITGLDKEVVKENGAKHYLAGDDEEFDSDNFDDIKRAIASALSNAEENSLAKYYYEQIQDALMELGTIKKLDGDGVELEVDLTNLMSVSSISRHLKEIETDELEDVFFQAEYEGEFDLPKLSIDDRYSAYASTEDFNDNFDINNYAKGGSLRPKNTNKNKIKNMKTSQNKLAYGGSIKSTGISKEDYFLVVQNWVYFTFNYPMGFVKDAFGSSRLTNHLQEKFSSAYTRYGSVGVLMSFWANLDNEHREMLSVWIKNNYFNSSSKKTQLQSISDEDYAKIITHWNMFCFNFPYNFIESVFGDNTSHYEEKWVRAYESASSTGAVNKFFTELSGDNQHIFTDWVYDNYNGMKYANGGNAGDWSVTDVTNAKYLGLIEFQDNDGEFHNFEVMETDDRLVFGGMTNSGFIESGYIEKDGFSTDETLQSLLEDLEVYYNDGGEYTSQIVFNERMAQGGKVVKKSNKNIRKKRTKKQPKVTRIQFEEGNYEYAEGGSLKSIKERAEKLLEESITYRWTNTDMGSGWSFELESPSNKSVFNIIEEMTYLDEFSPDDMGIEDYDELSEQEKDFYYEEWKESLLAGSFENFKEKCMKHLDLFVEFLQKDSDDNFAGGGNAGAKSKSKIKIIENKKEGKKTATRTLVKENNKGEKITYELSVGIHTTPKENRYADGWFEIYATDENDNEYFYSEGGLWIEGGRVYDYDGVYELSEKLRPLMSALNLNTQDIYAEGGSVDDYISQQEMEFSSDKSKMRNQYGKENIKDIEYQGFLAIDENDERLSDYEFEDEEFDRDNLLEVAKKYPQANYIVFHARIMGESDFGIEDELSPIDDLAMVFDMAKLNQYADGGEADDDDDNDDYADGGEVEDWMEEALASLIEETGNEDLEITHIVNSKIKYEFIASDGDVEYRVFITEGDAEQIAVEEVRDDLQESPENFKQDWLMNYIDGRDFFEEQLNDMNLSYVEDIESESDKKYANRLIAEMVENGILDEDDAQSGNAEELAEYYKDDYIALLTEGQLDEGMDGLQYFIDNFGENETFGMIVDNNLIDLDEASQDAVNVDGIAHFLSSYDGETLYLSNDCVAYRTN